MIVRVRSSGGYWATRMENVFISDGLDGASELTFKDETPLMKHLIDVLEESPAPTDHDTADHLKDLLDDEIPDSVIAEFSGSDDGQPPITVTITLPSGEVITQVWDPGDLTGQDARDSMDRFARGLIDLILSSL